MTRIPHNRRDKRRPKQPNSSGGSHNRSTGRAAHVASAEDILYGRQPVAECLKAARRKAHALHISESARPTPELEGIRQMADAASIPVMAVPPSELDQRLGDVNHQGVCLHVGSYPYESLESIIARHVTAQELPPLILALDHIQDPQNLGAILRNADGAGVSAVIIPKDRACAITPAVVRASAGATEHITVARVTNLVRSLRTLQKEDFWIAGLESCEGAKNCDSVDLAGRFCLVIGSEGKGMGRLVRETCDLLVSLPMRGHVDSLNASSAAAIAMYEIRRQQAAKATQARSTSGL